MISVMNIAMGIESIQSEWVGRVIDGRFTLLKMAGRLGAERVCSLPNCQVLRQRKAAIKLISADAGDADAIMAGWAATRAPVAPKPDAPVSYRTLRDDGMRGTFFYAVSEYSDEVLSEIFDGAGAPTGGRGQGDAGPGDQCCSSYLHGKGLVHGHVKPSNVMVVDDRLKLCGNSLQVVGQDGNPGSVVDDLRRTGNGYRADSSGCGCVGAGSNPVEVLTQRPPAWDRSGAGRSDGAGVDSAAV